MGVERIDSSDDPDKSDEAVKPDEQVSLARSGNPEASGSPSRRKTAEIGRKAPAVATDSPSKRSMPGGGSATAQESDERHPPGTRDRDIQATSKRSENPKITCNTTDSPRSDDKSASTNDDLLERMPSYGRFASLSEEFAARRKGREQAESANSKMSEIGRNTNDRKFVIKVDGKSARDAIDPTVTDFDVASGANSESERSGDRVISALDEGENDRRSRADRFRAKAHAGSEDLLDKVKSSVDKGVDVFGPRPTGQEVRLRDLQRLFVEACRVSREPCYPSDLTDEQWALVEPLLPPAGEGGRPEKHPRRAVVDAVLYVVRTCCSWRQLPADFPPWQTVYWYFVRWEKQRVTLKVLDVLRRQIRVADGRDAEPSAGIIDSQSVKGADTVGRDTRGYDAGKKINGRKRFIVTDRVLRLNN